MMKNRLLVAALALFAAHCVGPCPPACLAQQNAAGGNTASGPPTAATPGAAEKGAFYLLAEFTRSLNAKKLKPGDPVKAEVTQDVLSHGRIIIPVESKLIGHVTEVQSHRKDDRESRLGIVFDKVLLKHGMEVSFRGVLHALAAPAMRRSRQDEPDQMLAPGPMGIGQSSGSMPIGSGSAMSRNPYSNPGSSNSSIAYNPAGSPPPFSNGPPVTSVPATSPGAPNHTAPPPVVSGEQKPMSIGTSLGVFGLKGLSLTTGASASTPGPVILSRADDVKLESGTQVLIKVTDATVRQP